MVHRTVLGTLKVSNLLLYTFFFFSCLLPIDALVFVPETLVLSTLSKPSASFPSTRTSTATRTTVSTWKKCWPTFPECSLFHLCLEDASHHRTCPRDLAVATRTTLAAMGPWGSRPPRGQVPSGLVQFSFQDLVKQSVFQLLESIFSTDEPFKNDHIFVLLLPEVEARTAVDSVTVPIPPGF